MQIITHRLLYNHPDTLFTLYHLTDLHLGAAAAVYRAVTRWRWAGS